MSESASVMALGRKPSSRALEIMDSAGELRDAVRIVSVCSRAAGTLGDEGKELAEVLDMAETRLSGIANDIATVANWLHQSLLQKEEPADEPAQTLLMSMSGWERWASRGRPGNERA